MTAVNSNELRASLITRDVWQHYLTSDPNVTHRASRFIAETVHPLVHLSEQTMCIRLRSIGALQDVVLSATPASMPLVEAVCSSTVALLRILAVLAPRVGRPEKLSNLEAHKRSDALKQYPYSGNVADLCCRVLCSSLTVGFRMLSAEVTADLAIDMTPYLPPILEAATASSDAAVMYTSVVNAALIWVSSRGVLQLVGLPAPGTLHNPPTGDTDAHSAPQQAPLSFVSLHRLLSRVAHLVAGTAAWATRVVVEFAGALDPTYGKEGGASPARCPCFLSAAVCRDAVCTCRGSERGGASSGPSASSSTPHTWWAAGDAAPRVRALSVAPSAHVIGGLSALDRSRRSRGAGPHWSAAALGGLTSMQDACAAMEVRVTALTPVLAALPVQLEQFVASAQQGDRNPMFSTSANAPARAADREDGEGDQDMIGSLWSTLDGLRDVTDVVFSRMQPKTVPLNAVHDCDAQISTVCRLICRLVDVLCQVTVLFVACALPRHFSSFATDVVQYPSKTLPFASVRKLWRAVAPFVSVAVWCVGTQRMILPRSTVARSIRTVLRAAVRCCCIDRMCAVLALVSIPRGLSQELSDTSTLPRDLGLASTLPGMVAGLYRRSRAVRGQVIADNVEYSNVQADPAYDAVSSVLDSSSVASAAVPLPSIGLRATGTQDASRFRSIWPPSTLPAPDFGPNAETLGTLKPVSAAIARNGSLYDADSMALGALLRHLDPSLVHTTEQNQVLEHRLSLGEQLLVIAFHFLYEQSHLLMGVMNPASLGSNPRVAHYAGVSLTAPLRTHLWSDDADHVEDNLLSSLLLRSVPSEEVKLLLDGGIVDVAGVLVSSLLSIRAAAQVTGCSALFGPAFCATFCMFRVATDPSIVKVIPSLLEVTSCAPREHFFRDLSSAADPPAVTPHRDVPIKPFLAALLAADEAFTALALSPPWAPCGQLPFSSDYSVIMLQSVVCPLLSAAIPTSAANWMCPRSVLRDLMRQCLDPDVVYGVILPQIATSLAASRPVHSRPTQKSRFQEYVELQESLLHKFLTSKELETVISCDRPFNVDPASFATTFTSEMTHVAHLSGLLVPRIPTESTYAQNFANTCQMQSSNVSREYNIVATARSVLNAFVGGEEYPSDPMAGAVPKTPLPDKSNSVRALGSAMTHGDPLLSPGGARTSFASDVIHGQRTIFGLRGEANETNDTPTVDELLHDPAVLHLWHCHGRTLNASALYIECALTHALNAQRRLTVMAIIRVCIAMLSNVLWTRDQSEQKVMSRGMVPSLVHDRSVIQPFLQVLMVLLRQTPVLPGGKVDKTPCWGVQVQFTPRDTMLRSSAIAPPPSHMRDLTEVITSPALFSGLLSVFQRAGNALTGLPV